MEIWCYPNRKTTDLWTLNWHIISSLLPLYIYVIAWLLKLQKCNQKCHSYPSYLQGKIIWAKPNPLKWITWQICSDVAARFSNHWTRVLISKTFSLFHYGQTKLEAGYSFLFSRTRWSGWKSEKQKILPLSDSLVQQLLFQICSRIKILLSWYGLAHCRGKSSLLSLNLAIDPSYSKWCLQGWNQFHPMVRVSVHHHCILICLVSVK